MTPLLLFGIGLALVALLSGSASAEGSPVDLKKLPPPEPPEPEVPLPTGMPSSGRRPGQGPGISTIPGPSTGVPGITPGEALARERAARAEAEARGARARAAAADAARARQAAATAAANRDAAGARAAAAHAARAQAAAASEAQAARIAQAQAEAAAREAADRFAAESAARAKEAAGAAERSQKDAARIAALEGQIAAARGAANQKIRDAQDATAKANAAIRAANDAKALAGRARTAAEKAQADSVVRVKNAQARQAGAEAAAKRANAAVADANVKAQEATAALARAEKARKDAMDAATRAQTERDAATRAAAEREAVIKKQLADSEQQKAEALATQAAKAKETAASATQAARDAAKPAPPMPAPLPVPPPAQPQTGPAVAIETSPAVLEQKRQVIAKAFQHGVTKVVDGHKKARKPITQKQAVVIVNTTFTARNIPTGKPNPKDPRWQRPTKQIADAAAAAVNAISVPSANPNVAQPKAKPAPRPTPGSAPAKKPVPSVTTIVPPEKLGPVRDAYRLLIQLAMAKFAQGGKKISDNEALTVFQKTLVTITSGGVYVAVPPAQYLTEPSQFWAYSLGHIRSVMQNGIEKSVAEILFKAFPFNPKDHKEIDRRNAEAKQIAGKIFAAAFKSGTAVSGEFYATAPLKGGLLTFGWASRG